MSPGPPPTPTEILKARGSWRAERRKDQPQPKRKRPKKDKGLSEGARKIWPKLMRHLEGMGLLGECDGLVLNRYCQLLAQFWDAAQFVAKRGDTYAQENPMTGMVTVREYPQAGRMLKLNEQLLKIEQRFGLNPSARAALARPKENEQENRGKDRFFRRGGFAEYQEAQGN